MKTTSFIFVCLFLIVSSLSAAEVPPLKIVYFTPSDCKPLDDRQERLGRVMLNVQEFYRKGMQANGYGPKTFGLEWDAPKKLKLYMVQGKKRQAEYGRNDAGVVRDEVRAVLQKDYGIEANDEVLVIFQQLLSWKDGKATEIGPYVGGGSSLSGTAWLFEDALLDSNNLTSKEPGGYYHGPCSIGKFNTHYIGGLAHELGHALSLPHECELKTERKELGASLMGGGNHTYGMELRGEGKGTFLSPASALRLSVVRAIVGNVPGAVERAHWKVEELNTKYKDKKLILEGRVVADPPLVGIIVYNDNMNIPSDYDAKTWTQRLTGKAGSDGQRFRFEIDEFEKVPYQLRLVGVHSNGRTNQIGIDYTVGNDGPDTAPFNTLIPMIELKKLFFNGNRQRIDEILSELTKKYPKDIVLQRKAKHLRDLLGKHDLADVNQPATVKELDLTFTEPEAAKTGWGNPCRGHVIEDVFLQIGGEFFESGLYAHAPSVYRFKPDSKWNTLKTGFGLQDGKGGSVVFVVRGDGKELFRSEMVKDRKLRRQEIDVRGVKNLELIVEDGGNGSNSDWGLWIEPTLTR